MHSRCTCILAHRPKASFTATFISSFLMYTIASSSNTAAVIRRFASHYTRPFHSSIVIQGNKHSTRKLRKRKTCRTLSKFPWHGTMTRKNVICENGLLFQHRYFLTINLSSTINPCKSTDIDMTMTTIHQNCASSWFFFLFKVLNICWLCNLHNLAHYNGQRTRLHDHIYNEACSII